MAVRTFNSLASFARFLPQVVVAADLAIHHTAHEAGRRVRQEARRVIGTYEYGWVPLQPATIARKARGDTPLLETGEMRDSIEFTVYRGSLLAGFSRSWEVEIGSDNPKALWHELGTSRIPARPFLMGAVVHLTTELHAILGGNFMRALTHR